MANGKDLLDNSKDKSLLKTTNVKELNELDDLMVKSSNNKVLGLDKYLDNSTDSLRIPKSRASSARSKKTG